MYAVVIVDVVIVVVFSNFYANKICLPCRDIGEIPHATSTAARSSAMGPDVMQKLSSEKKKVTQFMHIQ